MPEMRGLPDAEVEKERTRAMLEALFFWQLGDRRNEQRHERRADRAAERALRYDAELMRRGPG